MKVSVIIPAYNTADMLSACLDSVISQSMTDWECIVVNDGSSDNTAEVLERYSAQDNRIKVITQDNAGVSAARNRGLDEATGEFVTFIDSDDYIDSGYFEQALSVIYRTDASMLISGYVEERKSASGDVISRFSSRMPHSYIPDAEDTYILRRNQCAALLFDTSASYWGYIRNWFRLATIKKSGLRFDSSLKYNEDRSFTLHYLVAEPYDAVNTVFNRPNYHYVLRSGSAMNQGFNPNHLIELEAFKNLCKLERKFFRDRRLNIAIRHAGLVRKFYLTGLAMRMGRYDSAVAEKMERIERDMLSLRDFLPPYASCSRVMMKRWLQNKKHRLSHIFKK